ncbi:RNA recognition motif domain-containing protein [Ditylenchus destructor]|nr:RNA recognition motif domain-containing protein [Ditylenchus destructor]
MLWQMFDTNSKKSRSNVVKDQKASKPFTADSQQKTHFGQMNAKDQKGMKTPNFNKNPKKSARSFPEDQKPAKTRILNENSKKSPQDTTADKKAYKSPTVKKKLKPHRFYITIRDLSKETTPESLREFYSQFGEIAVSDIVFEGEPHQYGKIAFISRESMDSALNSLPHCIDGKETKTVLPTTLDRKQHTLKVLDLSPKTTDDSLTKFYSKFGSLDACSIKDATSEAGRIGHVIFALQKDMHLAWDAQPHVIDGTEVLLQYGTDDLDLQILDMPEGITEETLRTFYSKYGQLRRCRVSKRKHGIFEVYISYSAMNEVNRAMDDRPHLIGGKPLNIKFIDRDNSAHVSLYVRSVPENVTEETLRNEFSKYGKPVFWKLNNKGGVNHSGQYGIVTYSSEQEVNRALDDRPQIMNGKPLKVNLFGKGHRSLFVSLFVGSLPENVTEETLRNEFSKYGKPIFWTLKNDGRFNQSGPYGFVAYGSEEEALKALNSGPHTIEGAVVDVRNAKEATKSFFERKV